MVEAQDRMQAHLQGAIAFHLELIRALDRRGVPAGQGATTTAAWLSDRNRVSPAAAGRLVKLATVLDNDLPAIADALADGDR